MACSIQIKAVNGLLDAGVINSKREILNMDEFSRLNIAYTQVAKDKYGLPTEEMLFSVKERRVKMPTGNAYYRDNYRTIYRAVPREDLFNQLESLLESLLEGEKSPISNISYELEYISAGELVNSEDPLANKAIQDEIMARDKELRNLIKCVNGS